MNRREFIKRTVGVGVGLAIVPSVDKAKPEGLTKADVEKIRAWFEENDEIRRMQIIAAEKMANPACVVYPDGRIEPITYEEFYKV